MIWKPKYLDFWFLDATYFDSSPFDIFGVTQQFFVRSQFFNNKSALSSTYLSWRAAWTVNLQIKVLEHIYFN